MNAWQRLLAASTLAIGSAWDLITHPKLGSGVVVNTGAVAVVLDTTLSVALVDHTVAVSVGFAPVAAVVSDRPYGVVVNDGVTAAVLQLQ